MKNTDSKKKISLIFGGDYVIDDKKYIISSDIIDLFNTTDLRFLNLEAPILDNASEYKKSEKAGLNLHQNLQAMEILKQLKITHVSGANNHVMDFGIKGYDHSKKILNANKISISGCGRDENEASEIISFNEQIKIICACEEEFGIANKNHAGCYSLYRKELIDRIKTLKKENKFVIIYPHGGSEMVPFSSRFIADLYHKFIDAGADIIIGHHPHIAQGMEIYNNKFIIYSLGNFIHYIYPKSWGVLFKLTLQNNKIIGYQNICIKLSNNKLLLLDEDFQQKKYITKISNALKDESLLEALLQEQAMYLYNNCYIKYFTNLNPKNQNIFGKISTLLNRGEDRKKTQEYNDLVMLHLFRNRSHQEFIETALKLKAGEIEDYRTKKTAELFDDLMQFIKNEL
jgi:poly-gamma-glutamate synthesis protein (capsule biosynthesis protein)